MGKEKKEKQSTGKAENKEIAIRENGKVKRFFQKTGEVLKKKWLVNGSKTLLLVAVIIGIYVGAHILLEKATLPEYDFTPEKIYTLTQETKDKISSTDKDVKITLINYNGTTLSDYIDKYREINNKITIEKVDDLATRADLMQEYGLEPSDKLVIIQSEGNEKTLKETDLMTYDYTSFSQIDITEEAITNGILHVTTEYQPKVYFMTSHMMYDKQNFSTILDAIEAESYKLETLDILANGGIPEDSDCLIITTLKEDITDFERDKLIDYIKNGGTLMLLCGPNLNEIQLTNFQKVLDEYGLKFEKGVVFEGDSTRMVSGYPDFIVENTMTNSITKRTKYDNKLLFNRCRKNCI